MTSEKKPTVGALAGRAWELLDEIGCVTWWVQAGIASAALPEGDERYDAVMSEQVIRLKQIAADLQSVRTEVDREIALVRPVKP